MSHSLRVLKFGGSSLATPEQIRAVAGKIAHLHEAGHRLIVVVSAMGKSTDDLLQLARQVSSNPNRRELDMLLTTGERVSMALMSMALHDFKCPSISFTGSQAGVLTDGDFTNARILELRPLRVAESLAENKVVVLAGFQGVDPKSREITTLGRGGSETTAVAMAAHFKAERCEFLKDVDGVYSADPKLVSEPHLFKSLPIDVLYEFCFWGAKVLNYRAVEWARQNCVPLAIGNSSNFLIGTEITAAASTRHFEENVLMGVNSHPHVAELSCSAVSREEGEHALAAVHIELDLAPSQILRAHLSGGTYRLLVTNDQNKLTALLSALANSSKFRIDRRDISSVTRTYSDASSDTQIVPVGEREAAIRAAHDLSLNEE